MGLFKTKKKHSVNTTVTRVIDNPNIRDSVKTAVITSLRRNDEQMVESVLEELVSSIGVRANRLYNYAGNTYTYGRPQLYARVSIQGDALVAFLIKDLIGVSTTITYSYYAPQNKLHIGWMTLVNNYGYKSSTNALDVLSASHGSTVYLKDMKVVITPNTLAGMSENSLDQWGTPPNAGYTPERPQTTLGGQVLPAVMEVDPLALEDYLLVSYVWLVPTPKVIDGITITSNVLHEDTLVIPINDPDDYDYFQVKYSFGGNDGYWSYKAGLGTYPDLDAIFNPEADSFGSFFPFSYFRLNNVSMGASPTSQAYLTTEKMLNYIGINYADMVQGIHDNPDIGQVEQAILMFAVPANTTNEVEQNYLFDFFNRMYLNSGGTAVSNISSQVTSGMFSRSNVSTTKSNFTYVIQDSQFKMSVGIDSIFKRKRAGVVAPVGQYTSQYVVNSVQVAYTEWNDDLQENVTKYSYTPRHTHFFRHQLTANVYEEVEVVALKTLYYVWGGMTTIGDELDPLLLIPLDYSVTAGYSIPNREELYSRSLHLVFNSHIITKIKWYQTGFFKILMVIVAIVIAYYTGQWELVGTVLAAGGVAAVTLIFELVLQYILVAIAIKLFVKLVGVKFAFIVALLAVVAAAYGYLDAGSMANAPWAGDLLTMATNLADGVGDAIQEGMKTLQRESIAFGAFAESQLELLEKAKSLLDTSVSMSPFVIFGESPDDFYNRTVHSGNIGVMAIDAVSSYVDISLKLPELVDTIR